MVEGSCHCGAVRVSIPEVPQRMTLCNCSICRRLGALWAYYPQTDVRIHGHPASTQGYVWGDRTLSTVRCASCGCVMFWEPLKPNGDGRMGVNMRNFDPALLEHTTLRRFDGAVTWKYVD